MPSKTWDEALGKLDGMIVNDQAVPILYFISARGKPRHPVKIGRSTDRAAMKRLAALQTGYPHRLEFIFICEAGPEWERKAHQAFAHLRLNGEWFKRGKALLDFLKQAESDDPNWRRLCAPPLLVKAPANM